MNILLVHPDLTYYGGAEVVVVRLAQFLHHCGIRHAILTTGISERVRAEIPQTEIITVKPKWSKKNQTGVAAALHDYILSHKEWDLINIHNYPGELAAYRTGRPVVWMCNEPPQFHLGSTGNCLAGIPRYLLLTLDRAIVRNYIRRVIVADEYNAHRFENLYGIKPLIIPYGIDCGFFSSGNGKEARKKYFLGDSFVLLQVGILSPLKNQMASIQCLESLKHEIPGIRLVLAGKEEGAYKSMLEDYIRAHNLQQDVYFTGHVTREDVRDLYHACDVAIFPVHSQGSWLSPFEALCAKKPVIVSSEFTAAGIIRHEGIGIVTDSFTAAVREICQFPEKYTIMAEKGKTWVDTTLSWDVFCSRMVQVCEDTMIQYHNRK